MANNPSETKPVTVTDEELSKEKVRLLNEITFLGKKLEEGQNTFDSENVKFDRALAEKKTELESILKKLDEHGPLLVAGQKELDEVTQQVADAKDLLSKFDSKQLNENKAILEQHQADIKVAEAKKGELEGKVTELKNATADLETKKTSKLKEISDLDVKHQRKLSDFSDLVASHEVELSGHQAKVNALVNQHEGLIKNIATSHDDLSSVNEAVGKAKTQLADTQASIEKAKSDSDTQIATQTAELSKREKAVEEREGLASNKETWIKEKANALRAAKQELELFFGRKCPVNIPTEDVL